MVSELCGRDGVQVMSIDRRSGAVGAGARGRVSFATEAEAVQACCGAATVIFQRLVPTEKQKESKKEEEEGEQRRKEEADGKMN